MKTVEIRVRNKTFRIKDCKGMKSVKGLMFDSLQDHDGALIYGNDIWMPFVSEKLNLIFLDKDFRVLEQKIAVPLTLDPITWKTYKNRDAKYCLELKEIGLKIPRGSRIKMLNA